jgi:hypothetical protein
LFVRRGFAGRDDPDDALLPLPFVLYFLVVAGVFIFASRIERNGDME